MNEKLGWDFNSWRNGSQPANELGRNLDNTSLSPLEILLRESLQNSLDARENEELPIRFNIKQKTVSGSEKKALREGLGLKKIENYSYDVNESTNWFEKGKTILDKLDDPTEDLPVLILSDSNAKGLGGCWNSQETGEDRFISLVLSFYTSAKIRESIAEGKVTRGSYGVGKMSFTRASPIRTVIFNSTFKEDERSGGAYCRAIAISILPMKSNERDGFAVFGEQTDNDDFPRSPLINQEAHNWIKSLGFENRDNDDHGTTVMVLGAEHSVADIKGVVEKWWWPILSSGRKNDKPIIKIIDNEGESTSVDLKNNEIRAFISAYTSLIDFSKTEQLENDSKQANIKIRAQPKFNAGQEKVIDVGGLLVNNVSSLSDFPSKSEYHNKVAFIREGMVIEYNNASAYQSEDYASVVGVFEPKIEVSNYFMLSEDEAHKTWNPDQTRLKEYPNDYDGKSLIQRTLNQIKQKTQTFQNSFNKSQETSKNDNGSFLHSFFRKFLSNKTPGPNVPLPETLSPYSIQKKRDDVEVNPNDNSTNIRRASYKIRLSDNIDDPAVKVKILVKLRVASGANTAYSSQTVCSIHRDGKPIETGDNPSYEALLERNYDENFIVEGLVHNSWVTRWDINISKID